MGLSASIDLPALDPPTSERTPLNGCTLVIHGSFSTETVEDWWRRSGGFLQHLDREVGNVWRIVDDGGERVITLYPFSWPSLRPTGEMLTKLGSQVADNLRDIARNDPPPIDIIAHSHGGNVIVHALAEVAAELQRNPEIPVVHVRHLIFLGTPHIVRHERLRHWPDDPEHPFYSIYDRVINLYTEEDIVAGPIAAALTRGKSERELEPLDVPRATDILIRTDVGVHRAHRALHSNAMARRLGRALRGEIPWTPDSFPAITDKTDDGERP